MLMALMAFLSRLFALHIPEALMLTEAKITEELIKIAIPPGLSE